jgi:catechol 2,3-dioxygenase-like lactoylglutathione lyase family enzyme
MRPTIEHLAITHPDPTGAARWYADNLGFEILKGMDQSPFTHFLKAPGAQVMLEIYNNPAAPPPDYHAMHPLTLHIAFWSEDVAGDRARLLAAGATPIGDVETTPEGFVLCLLRDPWGVPLQLIHRPEPLL